MAKALSGYAALALDVAVLAEERTVAIESDYSSCLNAGSSHVRGGHA